jgi:syntaxin 5
VKQRKAQGSSKSAEGKQIEEHNHNVVMLLQNKLADTSMTFKDVLEVRTQVRSAVSRAKPMYCFDPNNSNQNMKESKDRTEQFMYSAATAANQAPASQSALPYQLTSRTDPACSRLISIFEHTATGSHGGWLLWPA